MGLQRTAVFELFSCTNDQLFKNGVKSTVQEKICNQAGKENG